MHTCTVGSIALAEDVRQVSFFRFVTPTTCFDHKRVIETSIRPHFNEKSITFLPRDVAFCDDTIFIQIYVRWPNDFGAATLHILVPQASIILLGYGPPSTVGRRSNADPRLMQHDHIYSDLMSLWFSEEGYVIPQVSEYLRNVF